MVIKKTQVCIVASRRVRNEHALSSIPGITQDLSGAFIQRALIDLFKEPL
jgi:hypothetical protein